MTVYIVKGTTESVYQDRIGGDFTEHYSTELVCGFLSEAKAEEFIKDSRLTKPKKASYSGTEYYKGGYYEMEVESVEIDEL